MSQREGRIIRQGNENPEVEICTYVTENTFDSYLYQLVENKQKFIGQIMTSKSPVRSDEDIDEQALSYAEKKAAGSAILEACRAMKSPDSIPLGRYRGFAMELYFDPLSREEKITLISSLRHTAMLGTDLYGNIQRLDNILKSLPSRLAELNAMLDMDRPENEIVDSKPVAEDSRSARIRSQEW